MRAAPDCGDFSRNSPIFPSQEDIDFRGSTPGKPPQVIGSELSPESSCCWIKQCAKLFACAGGEALWERQIAEVRDWNSVSQLPRLKH